MYVCLRARVHACVRLCVRAYLMFTRDIVMVLRVPVEGRALTALSRVEHDDSRKKH